jgi:choline monooxygenase
MTTTEHPRRAAVPLSRAETLPSRYYLDPSVLEVEKERIFGRTWQLVARTDELQRVGDFVPVTVLDEPVVITRAPDGELRAFYNVCRHRAGQVALSRGNRKSLQCRYHGWTYGLDGGLRACPEMEETEGFRKEDFGLVPVRVERWGPFVFVNLSEDAPSLAEMMGDIPAEVEQAGYDVDRMRPVERREYVVECNWKVYVDNYLEGYHLPIAHPQLYKELDYDSYRVEEFRYHSKQHAPIRELKPGEEIGVDRRYLRQPGAEDSALY